MQRPLGALIVPELLVTAGSWHLVGLELDVTHRGDLLRLIWGYFPGEARREALLVQLVGLDEGGQVVGGRWRHHMQRVLVELQVGLLANAKTCIF